MIISYPMLAEFIGGIASLLLLYSATQKNDKKLIILQGYSNVFWIVHYTMFGAFTGVVACCFGVARNAFVFKWKSKRAKQGFTLVFAVFCIAQLFFIEHIVRAVPILAIFIISYGVLFLQKNQLTACLYVGNGLLFVFSIYIGSISATINYILMICLLTFRLYQIKKV